jgi:hypothetical protein
MTLTKEKQSLGERLLRNILDTTTIKHRAACQITGCLLELDSTILLHFLTHPTALAAKVAEAVHVLEVHAVGVAAAAAVAEATPSHHIRQVT